MCMDAESGGIQGKLLMRTGNDKPTYTKPSMLATVQSPSGRQVFMLCISGYTQFRSCKGFNQSLTGIAFDIGDH